MDTVRKISAEAQAIEILRNAILQGDLEAGCRLIEMNLAEKLRISRGTIRTALHQLSAEGLVTQTPYTGWAVTSLSAEDSWELYTLRSSLEGLAVRLTTEMLDRRGKVELEGAFRKLEDAGISGAPMDVTQADFSFHKLIVLLANNSRLQHAYRLVEQQIRILISSTNALIPNSSYIVDQHRPILDAIVDRNKNVAEDLIAEHILLEGEKLHRYLSNSETST